MGLSKKSTRELTATSGNPDHPVSARRYGRMARTSESWQEKQLVNQPGAFWRFTS